MEIKYDSLPISWSTPKISEIALLNPTFDKTKLSDDTEVSFVPMTAVHTGSGVIDVSGTRKLSAVKKGYTPFLEGDILFAKITPCMENGKMAIVPALRNGIGFGSTEFHVLRPSSSVNTKFVYIFVSSKIFRMEAERYMSGAVGQRRVATPYLTNCEIPLPSLLEQQHIVAKIEELFSELDNGIESLKKAREQLKTYRQAVLKYAFEGKLTKEWRTRQKEMGNSPEPAEKLLVRIKKERQTQYQKQVDAWQKASEQAEKDGSKKPAKPKKPKDLPPLTEKELAELPELPEGWEWVYSEVISEFITKGTTPEKHKLHQRTGEIPFIKVYNLTHDGSLDFSVDPTYTDFETHCGFLSRSMIYPGDVLMNIVGPPLGKVSVVPDTFPEWNINQAIARYRPYNSVRRSFLKYYLLAEWTIRLMISKSKATAGQFNLTLEICRELPFPLCSLEEQDEIISYIDSRLSVCDQLEKTIKDSLRKAEALRQSILKKAFEGELTRDWREQHPELVSGENSAEKLLERIKAERNSHKSLFAKGGHKNIAIRQMGLPFEKSASPRIKKEISRKQERNERSQDQKTDC